MRWFAQINPRSRHHELWAPVTHCAGSIRQESVCLARQTELSQARKQVRGSYSPKCVGSSFSGSTRPIWFVFVLVEVKEGCTM